MLVSYRWKGAHCEQTQKVLIKTDSTCITKDFVSHVFYFPCPLAFLLSTCGWKVSNRWDLKYFPNKTTAVWTYRCIQHTQCTAQALNTVHNVWWLRFSNVNVSITLGCSLQDSLPSCFMSVPTVFSQPWRQRCRSMLKLLFKASGWVVGNKALSIQTVWGKKSHVCRILPT